MNSKTQLTYSRLPFLIVLVMSLLLSCGGQEDIETEVADEARWKALLQKADQLYQRGLYAEATINAEEALTIAVDTFGSEHPNVAQSLNNLAKLYDCQGKYVEAELLYRRALAIMEKALGPDHPDVGIYLYDLASRYVSQGKYAEAEPLYRRALAIFEKVLGPDHAYVLVVRTNLAKLYKKIEKKDNLE